VASNFEFLSLYLEIFRSCFSLDFNYIYFIFQKILKGQFSWTVTELTMAITILTLFHSLSGFAFGCGINENYVQQLQRQHEAEQEEKLKQTQRALNAAQMAAAARLKKMEKSENSRDQDNDELSDEEEELDENDDEAEDYDQEDDQYYDDDDNERAKGPRGSSSRRRARRRRHNQNAYASGNEIGVNDDEGGDSDANGELINEELTTTAETTGSGELGGQFYAANRTSRSNYRNSDSQCDIIASQMSYRARSNSTGTSNRTLSNSVSRIHLFFGQARFIQRVFTSSRVGCENYAILR
jgi:hypothetical protein